MPMDREEILRTVRDEDIEVIRMQFVDVPGQIKSVAITPSRLERALESGVYFDGSSIEGFSRISESDQYLVPDPDTFCVFSWRSQRGKVARLICDVCNPDGTPFSGDPRAVLKREVQKAREMGYTFQVGPECEFFLFQTDDRGRPTTGTDDEAGYFDLGPLDHGETVRREICRAMEQMGFSVETSHHECAAGQHEIDFRYAEALRTADDIMTFRLGVKTLAWQNGLHATFMPKPLFGQPGSGMHLNLSLFRDGKNVFCRPEGRCGLSDEAYAFIAGILDHVRGFTAVTNPLVNSYKRLLSGFEAPCWLSWSASNRSALIRIPAERGEQTRVELRSPDPSCNPYLAIAVCLAAGLDGIRRGLQLPTETTENLYDLPPEKIEAKDMKRLPSDLGQALEWMRRDNLVTDTLGEHVAGAFLRGKEEEWRDFCTHVSDWEREKYITAY